jgi:hypothetical protein
LWGGNSFSTDRKLDGFSIEIGKNMAVGTEVRRSGQGWLGPGTGAAVFSVVCYSATARMAGQRQQGWPVAAYEEDGVTDAARQGLCRAARHVDGGLVASYSLLSRLVSLVARCF